MTSWEVRRNGWAVWIEAACSVCKGTAQLMQERPGALDACDKFFKHCGIREQVPDDVQRRYREAKP